MESKQGNTIMNTTKDVSKRFAHAFEELRYRRKVKTKKEFCEKVGIYHSSNLRRIEDENENNEPTVTNILNLVNEYNVSLNWLFHGEGGFLSSTE